MNMLLTLSLHRHSNFCCFFLNILTCHLYIFFYELSECSEQVSDDLALTLWCFPYLFA